MRPAGFPANPDRAGSKGHPLGHATRTSPDLPTDRRASPKSWSRRSRSPARMRRHEAPALLIAGFAVLALIQPVSAQGFFERLFGPPRGAPVPQQPVPQPQYRPQPQFRPQPQQRRPQQSAPQQAPQPNSRPNRRRWSSRRRLPTRRNFCGWPRSWARSPLLRPLCTAPDGRNGAGACRSCSRRKARRPDAGAPRRRLQQGLPGLCPHLPGLHALGAGGVRPLSSRRASSSPATSPGATAARRAPAIVAKTTSRHYPHFSALPPRVNLFAR